MSSACDVFVVINNLLLKIKYKLYVSVLSTSIPFVFASIFKFIVRGPNPGNSPLHGVRRSASGELIGKLVKVSLS